MAKTSVSKTKKTVAAKTKKAAKAVQKPIKKLAKKVTKKVTAKPKKKKVAAIPKGYHSITPYLIMTNDAAKAIDFYKKVFGAKEALRMDGPDGKVMHAELKIGDAKIMLADECPDMEFRGPNAYGGSLVGIHLYTKNVDEVVKNAVKNGAKLLKAVEDMFYGDRSGTLQDPHGHQWTVSTHIEDVTPAQIRKRVPELFSKKA
jgi:PhnB protein